MGSASEGWAAHPKDGLRPSGRWVGGRGTEAETNAHKDNRKAALTAKSTLRYRRLGEMKKSTPHGVDFYASLTYSMMLETTPEATVRPPSRIAKRRPSSIAMGVIRVISILMLSPGITISTPSGSLMVPVTSVVLK